MLLIKYIMISSVRLLGLIENDIVICDGASLGDTDVNRVKVKEVRAVVAFPAQLLYESRQ